MVKQLSEGRSRVGSLGTTCGSAFTLIEILVVIVIGLIILSIAVPAFQTMAYSSNQSLAVNGLAAATQMARDTAVISGNDGAVVFIYEPEIGKIQIIPAVQVGTIREVNTLPSIIGISGQPLNNSAEAPYFERDVFVPSAVGQPLELPRFWNVRGFAGSGMMIELDSTGAQAAAWYNSLAYGGTDVADAAKEDEHWVFPESGFFNKNAQVAWGSTDGDFDQVVAGQATARQTFMVRFDARTGALSRETNSAIFVNPRNSRNRPYGDSPALDEVPLRVDLADSVALWASRLVLVGDLDGDGVSFDDNDYELREQLIGNPSNDTILVKPVTRLALYDERKLAIGVGARALNRDTNTLYQSIDLDDAGAEIEFDLALFDGVNERQLIERINQWIGGNTTFVQDGGDPNDSDDTTLDFEDEPLARLYLIQPYTGELQEVLR